MGWFDDMFGGSQAPAAPVAPQQAVPQNYGDFLKNYTNAAALNEKYSPHPGIAGLIGWLGGGSRDAAIANASVNAPGAYLALQQAQQQNRTGNVSLGQDLGGFQGTGIDPIKLMNGDFSGLQGGQPAPQGQPAPGAPPPQMPQSAPAPQAPPMIGMPSMDQPQGQPASQAPPGLFQRLATGAGGAGGMALPPSMGAPQGQPQAQQPSVDPQVQQRAMLMKRALFLQPFPKFAEAAAKLRAAANQGAPDNAQAGTDGYFHDAVSGKILTGSSEAIAAHRAYAVGQATADAGVGAANAIKDHAGGVDMGVNRDKIQQEAEHTLTPYVENGVTKQGTVAQAVAAAHAGNGGFTTGFADPDTHKAQVAEVVTSQEKGDVADKTIGTLAQLGQALKQFPQHGRFGPAALKVFQGIDGIGLASPTLQAQIASGELANQGSASVVAAMTKDVSARGPVAIFRYIDGIKPSIKSAEPWLAIQALQQDAQRQKDLAEFTPQYYGNPANATKLDAQSEFNKTHPIEMYASRVLPISLPARGTPPQVGYTYNLPNHGPATWDGQQFQPVGQ